jgi:hypothetical protein
MMKKLMLILTFGSLFYPMTPQVSREDKLLELEKSNKSQEVTYTATMTSASRLFKNQEDLTSVILVIPKGSQVIILGSDSTYYKVSFEENEGFIFRRHAVIDKIPLSTTQPAEEKVPVVQEQSVNQPKQQISRFTYLENKYGSSMAARISEGKVWKGMNAEMVRDSWGKPDKINREINGNDVKEEWLYKSTWLYLENNTLVEWGPVGK